MFKKFLKWFFLLAFIAAVGTAIFKQQDIIDWWKLRNYVPPAAVAQLAANTTMNDKSRRIFYSNQPAIQEKAEFYKSCEENEKSIVLGCYKPVQGIFILNVTDKRLAGIQEVTAAHEFLHAAYDRLSETDKRNIDKELIDFYASLNDANIKSKIELYKKGDADIANELHSIVGTEVAKLTPSLETYYSRYFTNRSKIASFASAYQAVFADRKAKLQAYDAQLTQIENQVKANNDELLRQQAVINAEVEKLNSYKASGNIEKYNSEVPYYNSLLPPYRNLANKTQTLVNQYKSILDLRNSVAAEAQELNKALDSRIQEPSQTKV